MVKVRFWNGYGFSSNGGMVFDSIDAALDHFIGAVKSGEHYSICDINGQKQFFKVFQA